MDKQHPHIGLMGTGDNIGLIAAHYISMQHTQVVEFPIVNKSDMLPITPNKYDFKLIKNDMSKKKTTPVRGSNYTPPKKKRK